MKLYRPFYYLYSANFKDMTNIEEIWQSLPYCNYYLVSNFGNVKTTYRPVNTHSNLVKIHKPKPVALTDNGHGYKLFGTKFNNKKKNFYIHRVVAELFIPNPNNLPEVNHIDANKSNNHVSNLEWVSTQSNRDHAVINNLIPNGESSPNSRLTEAQVIEILRTANGNPKVNRKELAIKYGVVDTAICRIISGKRWRRIWERERGFSLDRLTKTNQS